jgi:hypothetical protein
MSSKLLKHSIVTCAEQYGRTQRRKEIRSLYDDWRPGIPRDFFKRFIHQGLQPFLARYGYSLNQSWDQLERYCAEWAFAHVQMQRYKQQFKQRTFMKQFHTGGEEHFDWFQFTIPYEDWETLADAWKCPEFLDDSDIGIAQRLDLSMFVWNLIDLVCSKRHIEWLQFHEDGDEDDIQYLQPQFTADEGHAFGGDRRTH